MEKTATSVNADEYDDFMAKFLDPGEIDHYANDTIVLPTITGITVTIDGATLGREGFTINALSLPANAPLFLIPAGSTGTYIFENLTIYNNQGTSGILVEGGSIVLKDSVIRTQGICIQTTSNNVTLQNSSLCSEDGSAILFRSNVETVLSIENCTIECAGRLAYAIDIECKADTALPNSIDLSNTLFVPGDGYSGSAIKVTGNNAHGSISIVDSMILWLTTRETGVPIVDIDFTTSNMEFHMYGTSIDWCLTGWDSPTQPGSPILSLKGVKGDIINSTLSNNKVYNATSVPIVLIEASEMDLIHNTFYDNSCTSAFNPYTMDISTSTVGLINNLIIAFFHYSTTTTIINGTPVVDEGNVNVATYDIYDMVMSGVDVENKTMAGCDLPGGAPEAPQCWIPVREVTVFMPHPESAAYTAGVTADVAGVPLPEMDQRGLSRLGKPVAGSVGTQWAIFDAAGGYFDTEYGYMYYSYHGYKGYEPDKAPYFFWNMITTHQYEKMAIEVGADGAVVLPEWLIIESPLSTPIFLGWNTDQTAPLPDPFLVVCYRITMGSFEAGETYYAKYGTECIATFILGDVGKIAVIGSDRSVVVPSFTIPPGSTLSWKYYNPETKNFLPWTAGNPVPFLDNMIFLGALLGEPVYPTVDVEFRNGDSSFTITIPAGTAVSKPADPEMIGYEFIAWFTAETGGSEWDFTTTITSDLTLYARWVEALAVYDVTFDPCNGSPTVTVKVNHGRMVPVPKMPALEGYTFNGWFTAAEKGTKWNFNSPVTKNMTLYAQWVQGGGTDDKDPISNNDTAIIIGALFAGVLASVGIAGVSAATGGLGMAGKATLAQALQGLSTEMYSETSGEEKNRRAVIFDPQNGKSSWASSVFHGRLADRPGDPKGPAGMKFSHWSESPNGPPFSFMTPITKNTHLYGVYIPKD